MYVLCTVADVVLVLDNERLLVQLQKDLFGETHILPLPKSAGVSHIFQTHLLYRDYYMYTLIFA